MLAENLVNYENALNIKTWSKLQEDARDVLLNEFDKIEQEVERLREEIEAIGKAHHKDIVILGGLYLENKSLKAENARLREAARWIPVEERLPEKEQRVQVYVDDTIVIATYSNGLWWYDEFFGLDYDLEGITHWRTLPEPPEVK